MREGRAEGGREGSRGRLTRREDEGGHALGGERGHGPLPALAQTEAARGEHVARGGRDGGQVQPPFGRHHGLAPGQRKERGGGGGRRGSGQSQLTRHEYTNTIHARRTSWCTPRRTRRPCRDSRTPATPAGAREGKEGGSARLGDWGARGRRGGEGTCLSVAAAWGSSAGEASSSSALPRARESALATLACVSTLSKSANTCGGEGKG